MNKQRRKEIEKITEAVEQAKIDLDMVRDEEQESFDNIPESLQAGGRADQSQGVIEALETAVEQLDDVLSSLAEI